MLPTFLDTTLHPASAFGKAVNTAVTIVMLVQMGQNQAKRALPTL